MQHLKKVAESGDTNACVNICDYFNDELKAECSKHPDTYEHEAMYENSLETFKFV